MAKKNNPRITEENISEVVNSPAPVEEEKAAEERSTEEVKADKAVKDVKEDVKEDVKKEENKKKNKGKNKKEQVVKVKANKKGIEMVGKRIEDKTRAALEQEEKVGFIVPRLPHEPEGITHEVLINGVRYDIPKGKFVRIPKSIAKLLADHYNIKEEIGKEWDLEKNPDKMRRT